MRWEIDQDQELNSLDDTSGDVNPYRELIVNNAQKVDMILSQMEQWSILSNIVNYIQYDKYPKNFHDLKIRAVNKGNDGRRPNIEEGRQMLRVKFWKCAREANEEYLDIYEGIQSEIFNTTRFDENSDLSTIYLGKVDTTRDSMIKVEETFPISEQGYTVGKLLDGSECQILLETWAGKSFMSKSHYLHCKSLHLLQKFASGTQRIQVENGQYVSVLFIIPIIVDIHRHRFKIYTFLSDIHVYIDLVLGIKRIFELEDIINSWDCCFNFLNR